MIAETASFFCHKANTDHFFVGELAECVNTLLMGRHENRALTLKMVGLLLRALGIRGQRVVKGYRVLLTDAVCEQIHRVARAYHAFPAGRPRPLSSLSGRKVELRTGEQCTYARMYITFGANVPRGDRDV